jgi:hypothetical protein
VATPGGQYKYRYGRVELRFAKSALASDGATTRYRYRVLAKDGSVLRLANCVIPDTKIAVQAMNRRFGVQGTAMSGQRSGGGEDSGDITIQCYIGEDDGNRCSRSGGGDEPPPDDSPPPCDPSTAVLPCDGSGGPGGGPGGGDDPCYDCEPDEPPPTAPEGIDQNDYNLLNKEERKLCWANAEECSINIHVGYFATRWALNIADSRGLSRTDGGQFNAIRHARWAAGLARRIGAERARTWTDAHETAFTTPEDQIMDLWNNDVGIRIGAGTGDLDQGVLDAWEYGHLKWNHPY